MLLTSNDLTPNGVRISLRVLSALACLATLGLCIHSSISFSKHHLFAYISSSLVLFSNAISLARILTQCSQPARCDVKSIGDTFFTLFDAVILCKAFIGLIGTAIGIPRHQTSDNIRQRWEWWHGLVANMLIGIGYVFWVISRNFCTLSAVEHGCF